MSLKNILKESLLVPLIAGVFSFPVTLLLGEIGFFDKLNEIESGMVGVVSAAIGICFGFIIKIKYT